ncbi:WXG100 family type VII secretion target [Thermoactinospora rubra]|uniref:WXG100 family type VII secretion target n=1 Tax=Thermoactinospora rubra TaxID=1088767 RepID=UPI000A1104A6|nr:WXG100 family type VII secretion target [Thermoactinospora rubra]
MGEKVGGILPDMEKMSNTFKTQAGAVLDAKKALDAEAAKIPASWSGPNADKFKSAWEAYKSSFDKVAQALEEAQDGIRKNKEAIAAATGAG